MAVNDTNLYLNTAPVNVTLELETSIGNIELVIGTEYGNMKKSVYDINNNGIVDNAEKVNGFIVEEDLLEGTTQRITDVENNKVDKVAGKGLSTNDYTDDEKIKLSSIAENAEVNVNADWNATEGKAEILNKPSTFPPDTHTHDDRYFTETEVTNALALKANKAQEEWITPTLINGWYAIRSLEPPQYMKDSLGFVHFRGAIAKSAEATSNVAFILPVGYRPETDTSFNCVEIKQSGFSSLATTIFSINGNVDFAGAKVGVISWYALSNTFKVV